MMGRMWCTIQGHRWVFDQDVFDRQWEQFMAAKVPLHRGTPWRCASCGARRWASGSTKPTRREWTFWLEYAFAVGALLAAASVLVYGW
jgi:hypothetical protein